jgi:hypothetical protein
MVAPSGVNRSDLTTEHGPARAIGLVVLIGLTLAAGEVLSSARQFISGVNVVEVYATVSDKAGKPVTGLSREAFIVRENGDPQQVTTFAAGEFPLSAAVAIDRSFSMAGERLASAKSGARSFLGGLRATDESMLIAIGSTAGSGSSWPGSSSSRWSWAPWCCCSWCPAPAPTSRRRTPPPRRPGSAPSCATSAPR